MMHIYLLSTGCGLMGFAWLCASICVYIATLPTDETLNNSNNTTTATTSTHQHITFIIYFTQFCFGCALCIYAFSYALSIGSINWVFCSEIFPYRTRAKAGAITMAVYFGSHIYNTSIYTLSIKDIGIWGEYSQSIVNTNSNTNNSITSMNMGQSVSQLLSSLYTSHINNMHIYSNIVSKISKSSITNDMSTTTVIQPNNSATYYFLQLAAISLLLALYVYIFIPETKGILSLFFICIM